MGTTYDIHCKDCEEAAGIGDGGSRDDVEMRALIASRAVLEEWGGRGLEIELVLGFSGRPAGPSWFWRHRGHELAVLSDSGEGFSALREWEKDSSPAEAQARMNALAAVLGSDVFAQDASVHAIAAQRALGKVFEPSACLAEIVRALSEAKGNLLGELALLHALVMVKPGQTLAMAVTVALSERDQLRRRVSELEAMT